MKILFITDVLNWEPALDILEKEEPNAVFLGGDLVSDGLASYWFTNPYGDLNTNGKIVSFLEKYQSQIEKTMWKKWLPDIIKKIKNGKLFDETGYYRFEDGATNSLRLLLRWIFDDIDKMELNYEEKEWHNKRVNYPDELIWRNIFLDFYNNLEDSFRDTEFFNKQVLNHVDLFYYFLGIAGKNTKKVFVVKGNHDDYGNYYDANRINSCDGCYEISGKSIGLNDYQVLGLGYEETHYLRKLRPILAEYSDGIDIILTHSEEKRLELLTSINPLIVFRGHFRTGHYKVKNVDFVSAMFPSYITVEIEGNKIQKISYIDE